MSKPQEARVTAEEYLAMERAVTEEKHEYAFGEIYAMGGASERHVLIVGNITAALHNQFRKRPCRVYSADLRLCVNQKYRYTYPDVAALCGQPQFLDGHLDTLLNPDLIVEVLSESTRNYDRGDKFQQYRGIASVREYLLVDQDRVHVEHYSKISAGNWALRETDDLHDIVELPSIGVKLPLAEIYLKINFPAASEA